jgi:glycosyltransferase involved in cell wall biosynthesis
VEVLAAAERVAPAASGAASSVTRVRPARSSRDVYLALKRRLRRTAASSTEADARAADGYVPVRPPARWKRWVHSIMVIPDSRRGFILPAVAEALPRIRAGADLIYTSGPPHSVHLAGLALATLTGVRWVAEFRDPWTDNPEKSADVRSRFGDWILRGLERACLRRADRVVVVTEAARRLFAAKLDDRRARRILLVRNGVPASPGAAPATTPAGPYRIVYPGSLGQKRDPRPFLDAVAALRRRGIVDAERLRVEFIGRCKWYYDVSVEQYAAGIGIADLVSVRDPVPHAECARIMRDADLLLLLAQEQPAQVPNKLYEYLAAGRPVLAFADGETAELMERFGGEHYLVRDSAPGRAEQELERALRDGRARAVVYADDVLRELSTEQQMDRLVAALGRSGESAAPDAAAAREAARAATSPLVG